MKSAVFLLMWLTCLQCSMNGKERYDMSEILWIHDEAFDDVTMADNVIYCDNDVRNKLNCGMECSKNPDCKSFSYNSFNNVCCQYSVQFDQNVNSDVSPGSRYYSRNLTTTEKPVLGDCPTGFVLLEDPKVCFKVIKDGKTWHDARNNCSQLGARLIILDTEKKLTAVVESMKKSNDKSWYFIGLTDIVNEGQFIWEDGRKVNFTYWNGDTPNHESKDCVYLKIYPKSWVDENCTYSHKFICEKVI